MPAEPTWFHVYDSTHGLWASDNGDWGPYSAAAEFDSYDDAHEFASEQIKCSRYLRASTIIVIGDYGSVEI